VIPSPVDMRVVGVTFHKSYPKIAYWLADLPRKAKARLVREPDNQYDPNAIGVWVGKHQLGHIDRYMARKLAPEMDRGNTWRVRVDRIEVHPDSPENPAIWLHMERRVNVHGEPNK
jgi:hypothetical protein